MTPRDQELENLAERVKDLEAQITMLEKERAANEIVTERAVEGRRKIRDKLRRAELAIKDAEGSYSLLQSVVDYWANTAKKAIEINKEYEAELEKYRGTQ